MMRRIAMFALVLGLCTRTWCAAANGHGSIYVTTLPPGATVWMDGRYVGETPLFIDDVVPGHHVVLLTRSGWQPVSTGTDVNVGAVGYVTAVLAQNAPAHATGTLAKGTLQIRDAQGAQVWVDGAAVTSFDQPQTLAAGQHILAVARGRQRTASSFHIYPDTRTSISLAAAAQSQATALGNDDELGALQDYVPPNDFVVNGDDITIHYHGLEVECAVGSLSYTLNGKPGSLSVAPAMVGDKAYLPLSLLQRLAKGPT
jgi:PEGA domain